MKKYNLISKEIYKLKKFEEFRNFANDQLIEYEFNRRSSSPSYYKFDFKIKPYSYSEQSRINIESSLFYISLPHHINLIEKIYTNSTAIKKLLYELPNQVADNLIIDSIIEEIKATNDIEGVLSTRQEITEAIEYTGTKYKRFNSIANHYLDTVFKFKPLINEIGDFRKIYDDLLEGEIREEDIPDGNIFRNGPVYINKSYDGSYVHIGDDNEDKITENINKLIEIMNDASLSPLIKAIVCHYIIEYIHPFYDGNGRLGRFIMASYLSHKIDKLSALSINKHIRLSRKKYLDSFIEVSDPKNKADLTIFISNLLEIINEGQEDTITRLEISLDEVREIWSYVENQGLDEVESRVLTAIMENNKFTYKSIGISNKEISESLKITRTKTDKIVNSLESKGYLKQVSKNPLIFEFIKG